MDKVMWATITSVNDTTITVRFDNGDETQKAYRYPKTGRTPVVGERALFLGKVCIGIY